MHRKYIAGMSLFCHSGIGKALLELRPGVYAVKLPEEAEAAPMDGGESDYDEAEDEDDDLGDL
jgi:hypothetical protein